MATNFANLVYSARIFMIKLSSGSFGYILLDYLLLYMEYYLCIFVKYQTNNWLVHKNGENICSTYSG